MWKNAESWCLNEKGKWSATGWNIGIEMFTGGVPIWLEWTRIDNYGWDLGHRIQLHSLLIAQQKGACCLWVFFFFLPTVIGAN